MTKTNYQRMLENLGKLPSHCFSTLPSTGEVIGIKRGEKGYYTIKTMATATELNRALKVTKAQEEAMVIGSMFGWDSPGADPDAYPSMVEVR